MDTQQRGRSPSAGQRAHIRHTPSPSPHAPYTQSAVSGLGFDPSLAPADPTAHFAATTSAFEGSPYLAATQAPQFPQQAADQSFLQNQQALSQHNTPLFGPQGSHLSPDQLDLTGTSNADYNTFFPASDLDSSFLGSTLDPQLLDPQPPSQSVNPSDLVSMATTQAQSPTPPHLLPTMNNQHTPSPHASPNISQSGFPSPMHSRNASLDPSAAYAQSQGNEWDNMAKYRGHRRTPSDTYSDMSSAHASPFLTNQDSFETDQPSPLLNAQNDPQLFHDPVMQFGQFSLNDGNAHISPGHSPSISPRLLPVQQPLPQFQPNSFGGLNSNQFAQQDMAMFPSHGQEPFPSMPHVAQDFGQSDAMSPPEINIQFAPPSRQASFEPPKPDHQADALSPPDRSRSRNRMRAKSDPFSSASSRATTPGSEVHRSLSPNAAKSRSPSPSNKSSRRSSTSSVPNRDYILDLADPSRPPTGDGSNPKRTQKHPATFQCSLCPKRFTRAYNLRSHLRTHTDERPFVCSVCGKAFARQHDRKRHEGLHSGEKKFVCRGNLKEGNTWGCGRRFARADALGRHFRSEAGRICIRPLLEEEAAEKGNWDAQNVQAGNNGAGPFASIPAQGAFGNPLMSQPGFDPFANGAMAPQFLPAAILAQYPALAGIQWDQLPPAGPDEIEGEISGRSSFDASSGGEFFDEESDYQGQGVYAGGAGGWTSDYDGH